MSTYDAVKDTYKKASPLNYVSKDDPPFLFIHGDKDTLVPIGFMKHVEKALPGATHVELNCGHVPQVERPRETHAAIAKFLSDL